jgi:ribulose-phosphate 3-epimerase
MLIAPSILSADFGKLKEEIDMINQSEADWFHVDVMDGHFVPNISFGFPVMQTLKKFAQKPLDVHLMIEKPERYINRFAAEGADFITVHWETCPHLHRTLAQIRESGCKAGVALNPFTPIEWVADILADVDLILIMSVNPGFGGQSFIPSTLDKLAKAKAMIMNANPAVILEADGGLSIENAAELKAAGLDVMVAGNAVFGAANPQEMIARLKSI